MSVQERVQNIQTDLEMFDDDLEKYEYIIDLGKSLETLDEIHLKDENLVLGCTSKVWLICEKKEGKLYFEADSNAMIVKGLVYILIQVFNGLTPKEILSLDINLLESLHLSEIITPNRQSGVRGMLKRVKEYAHAFE